MDIGTTKDPGRELDMNEAREVNGGYIAPDLEDPSNKAPDDPLGGSSTPPVDYSTP